MLQGMHGVQKETTEVGSHLLPVAPWNFFHLYLPSYGRDTGGIRGPCSLPQFFAQDWGIQILINPSATWQAFYSLGHLLQLFIFQMQKILMQCFYILFKYCMKADLHCLDFLCNFGKMESGKEASVHIQLEGRPSILEMVSLKSDR